MKARHAGVVPGCGHYVLVHQQIVKVGDRPWVCWPCRKAQLGQQAA